MEDRSKAMFTSTILMFWISILADGLSQKSKEHHLNQGLVTPPCWQDQELLYSEERETRNKLLRTYML